MGGNNRDQRKRYDAKEEQNTDDDRNDKPHAFRMAQFLGVFSLLFLVPGVFGPVIVRARHYSSTFRIAMNASWGTSTLPMAFMRFLPAFCFSSSLRLRVMSPP